MASTGIGRSTAHRLVSLSLTQHLAKNNSLSKSLRHKFSAFASIPESVQEVVKESVLNQISQNDSTLWSSNHKQWNGTNTPKYMKNTNGESSIDEPINDMAADDPLDEWCLTHKPSESWPNLPQNVREAESADPFLLSKIEIDTMSASIRKDLIGTDHPVLNKAASYFFESTDGGKKIRPMMVVILSRALAETVGSAATVEEPTLAFWSKPLVWQRSDLPQAQRRLAEISEMIHTASLFHDDVIDDADTRRGAPAVHKVFGNKMAILAGDYLLARSSIALARLRNIEVVETMSTIIEHLVKGEVMQLKGTSNAETDNTNDRMIYYLQKIFYKTGSLMANSCKSAALLGGYSDQLVSASYLYGKHLGVAFQLVDDVLDFEGSASTMGKAALSDLNAGLATAPVLFAAEQYREIRPMVGRKFRDDGDVNRAVELVFASDGIQRTKELAQVHAELAINAILQLEPSAHRDALVHLAYKVVNRTR